MKMTNRAWILLLFCLLILASYQHYDSLNFVEISLNQASAVSTLDVKNPSHEKKEKIKVDVMESFKASEIQSLLISTSLIVDIRFEKYSGEEMTLRLEGASDEYENLGTQFKDWFRVELNKGELVLKGYEKKNRSYKNLTDLTKMAKVSKLVSEKHDGLKMVIQFPEGFQFTNIKTELVAANLKMMDLVFKKINIKTVSGDIEIKSSEGESLEVATVSGDGQFDINKLKTAHFESVSGQTILITSAVEPKITFQSVSGDLKLKMPKDSNVDVRFESMSGVLKNEFGLSKQASAKVEFSSLSGSAEVTKWVQ